MKKIAKELQPFQKTGAKFLAENYHALLADEMGLGKTVQALAACAAHEFKRVAVVCPASVRSGWKQEIVECSLDLNTFHIDSYEALVAGKFPAGPWDAVIIDEAHYLKNGESLRSQAMFNNETGLARSARFKWALTGTPVMNRPRELYPLLKTLANAKVKDRYDTFEKFAQQFCGAHWDGRGLNTRGATHLDELRGLLNGFMLRREIEGVMPEMPPVIISRPPLELTAEEMAPVYELEAEILNRDAYLSATKEDYAALGDLSRLRKATGIAKAKRIADFVEELITCGVGKVCVFYRHTAVAKILAQELGHRFPVIYQGGMSDAQKDTAKATFMEKDGDCEVFIGQMQASGTGINGLQTASNTIVFAEFEWSPEEMKQNMARLRRMGMDMSKPVRAYFPHVPGTIESAMVQVNIGKERVIEYIMAPAAPTTAELLGDLL
jgi:SWI/SNF-related matrix-associated actin-dependent regulator 1 of chromatin subfamily A